MSEDVKPKQFWIVPETGEINFKPTNTYPNKEYHVIELEPTMRLMKDMAEALEQINKEEINSMRPGGGYSKSARISYEALEKYKKFKDGLK